MRERGVGGREKERKGEWKNEKGGRGKEGKREERKERREEKRKIIIEERERLQ